MEAEKEKDLISFMNIKIKENKKTIGELMINAKGKEYIKIKQLFDEFIIHLKIIKDIFVILILKKIINY